MSDICFVTTNHGVVHQLLYGSAEYFGGSELQMSLTAQALARSGWKVSMVAADEGQDEITQTDGMQLIASFSHNGRGPWAMLHRITLLQRALGRAGASVYLLQGATWQAAVIARYCRHNRKRFLFWIGSNTDPTCKIRGMSRVRWWERGLAWHGMKEADAIIAQTEGQRELVREHLGRDAFIVHNIWPYETAVREPPAEPLVLWVANFRSVKRPEMVFEIARRLPDIKFLMVGGPVPKHEQYYAEMVERAKAIPNLTLTGFLPFPEADKLFPKATILLNTSSVEGFPNTYLQAWARGVPVVGSFDPDDIISRYELGVHFGTTDEAVQAIDRLCRLSREELQDIGMRGVEYVQKHHSPSVVVAQLKRVLEELCSQ